MSRLHAAKRRRLSPPDSDLSDYSVEEQSQPKISGGEGKANRVSGWNIEQDYESRPRKANKNAESTRLPIKTSEGWVKQSMAQEPSEEAADSFLGTDEDGSVGEEEVELVEEAAKVPVRQLIVEAKEELARLAALINEEPEEHTGSLRKLAEIAKSSNLTVKKLALATQLTVYKDVIPGYRIRPLSEEDMQNKVSKEVRTLRNFEQAMVSGYQQYLRELSYYAKDSKPGAVEGKRSLATVAITCACDLLTSVPHFNFRSELLNILVNKLSRKQLDEDFVKCRETLQTLFRNDEDGNASLEAVALLTKTMKARHYRIDESVLKHVSVFAITVRIPDERVK